MYTTTFGYDNLDRLTEVGYPTNHGAGVETVVTTYDAGGHPYGLSSGLATYVQRSTYRPWGALNRQQVGNGLWLDNDYDEATDRRWLTARYVGTLAGDEIVDRVLDLAYGYDPVGNVTAITDTLFSEAHTYAYDHRDRLTDWWLDGVLQQHYAYNQIGNITEFAGVTYSYPAAGQARPHALTGTTAGGSFGYNSAGYMVSRQDASGLPTYSYTWWPNHKLKKVTSDASNDQILFYHGPDDERVRKFVDTPIPGRDYNTHYVFPWYQLEKGCFRADIDCDGDVDILDVQSEAAQFNAPNPDPKYDQTGDGAVTVADVMLVAEKWLWQGAGSGRQVIKLYTLGDRLVAVRRGSELIYVFQDHLGSPALETDVNGAATARFRYQPYGTMRGTERTLPIDRGFTGQVIERGLGLHDYGARHYAQPLGRWIAPDSIVPEPGNPQAFNRYTYSSNNPVRFRDPTGHSACMECVGGGGGGFVIPVGAGLLSRLGQALNVAVSDVQAWLQQAQANPTVQRWLGFLFGNADKLAAGQDAGSTSLDNGGNTADPGGLDPNDPWRWGTNYRANYEQYYGVARDPNYQVHHVLPQQWREVLTRVNINVDDPRWLREVQAVPGDENLHARFFTMRWGEFASNLQGRTPTALEIIRFAQQLEQEYIARFGTTFYRQGEELPGQIDWETLWALVNAALQGGGP